MIPSLFPLWDSENKKLQDGLEVHLTNFCKDAFSKIEDCALFYESLLSKPLGYYQCPHGFTCRSFTFEQKLHVNCGVVAFPRFGTQEERRRAKDFPSNKISRETIETCVDYLHQLEQLRTSTIEKAANVLPQAFHELRKLNGAVLQHAEREESVRGQSSSLTTIMSAAELMRNNFDILEALSNIEGIKQLPNDWTINTFDLFYKMKRVYQEKATQKNMTVFLIGKCSPIIQGSQKSFPIVPAVLLENAIKYGTKGSHIRIEVSVQNGIANFSVENESTEQIDCEKCFERGTRFSNENEGGGFGLFLAKEVVECHKGKIRCQQYNGKVKMTVELPLVKVISHT